MIHRHLCLPGLVFISLLLACGSSEPTTPKSSANVSEFCNSVITAAVSMQTGCVGGGESFWRDIYSQVFDCTQLTKDVAAGVLSYDPQKGAQCLDQISKFDCDQTNEPSACEPAVVGHIPSGGACVSGLRLLFFSDCALGNYCDIDMATCGGTCKPHAPVGASCAYTSAAGSVSCEDGSECQLNTEVCVADVSEGQPCEGPTAGNCASGLYCEGVATSVAGVCRKRKTSGSCESELYCASNYLCIGAEGAKTCRKAKMLGDACTPGQGECYRVFAWCGSDGKCTDTRAQENQLCGSTDREYIQCASGLTCVLGTTGAGTCQKKGDKPAGSPCTSSTECGGTISYCDPTTKLCVGCD
jgi:hypothetical protein